MTSNPDGDFLDGLDNFDDDFLDANDPVASAQAESVLASLTNPGALPAVAAQPDSFFQLPGSQEFVEVRELTGKDEEAVDRSRRSAEPLRMVQTIIEAGLTRLGDSAVTGGALDEMLVGDREYLLTVIREATYGEEIDMGDTTCDGCGDQVHLTVDVKDIPVKRLNSSADAIFDVPLRKGGKAEVHLPTVSDQKAALANPKMTTAERNTTLLAKCVDTLLFADGRQVMVAGFPSVISSDLGLADRRAILRAIDERMPGPQYNDVTVEHSCGFSIRPRVEMVSLFPGL